MNGRKIIEILNESPEEEPNGSGLAARPLVSLEFFPPRTEEGVNKLRRKICSFKAIHPAFVDFTWGAGGSTSATTLQLSIETHMRQGLEVNMHLTCTNMDPGKVKAALKASKATGIRNIFALRGDPPNMTGEWVACRNGYTNALSLVKCIRKEYGDFFGIGIAGYPEGHPDRIKIVPRGMDYLTDTEKARCRVSTRPTGEDIVEVCSDKDFEIELEYLKRKVDAGADLIITQMFFDVNVYKSYVKACRAANINVPIIPGIMCIVNYKSFIKMTEFCKSRVPESFLARMNSIKGDDVAVRKLCIEFGCNLCRELLRHRVAGLHFYTLNSIQVPIGILTELGLQGSYSPQHSSTT